METMRFLPLLQGDEIWMGEYSSLILPRLIYGLNSKCLCYFLERVDDEHFELDEMGLSLTVFWVR